MTLLCAQLPALLPDLLLTLHQGSRWMSLWPSNHLQLHYSLVCCQQQQLLCCRHACQPVRHCWGGHGLLTLLLSDSP
jgi:hypothetical protein